ncbi:MAG: 3-deoxy-D-manno-octulosonic acid kinase [Rudaea sp.]
MAEADAIETRLQATDDGAILFDAQAVAQAPRFANEWFAPDYWHARGSAQSGGGGRGGITYARSAFGEWALRHYRRGGMVARFMGERYLWTGAERTRGFSEYRLLAALFARGLNVPRPVAARYRRRGAYYQADLITRVIPEAWPLAQRLAHEGIDSTLARRVGAGLAPLHAAGAYHADLNAGNVLIDPREVWLIDFDRGELRTPQRGWQQENLARLRRSLVKLGAARRGEAKFEHEIWQPLVASYDDALASANPAVSASLGAPGR